MRYIPQADLEYHNNRDSASPESHFIMPLPVPLTVPHPGKVPIDFSVAAIYNSDMACGITA